MHSQKVLTRFATREEALSEKFMTLNRTLDQITVKYGLPDHSDVNQQRYPWAVPLLSTPAFYAARLWEYPFALLAAELEEGMRCADIGCGMTAFTIYLQEVAKCEVIGLDPDVFDTGVHYKGHGVSREFIRRTGLKVIQCGMEAVSLESNTFDRVFCLSVIEHLPVDTARRGMQEIARILKPGGRAIITVDVNMHSDISHPLELIWQSGLQPLGVVDLRWPPRRFGIFCDGNQPADVFGMTLVKEDYHVETIYAEVEGIAPLIEGSLIPTLCKTPKISKWHYLAPLYKRLPTRFKRAIKRVKSRVLKGKGALNGT